MEKIHEYATKQLAATQLTMKQVGEGSGVPWRTVQKIASGEIKNPGVSHCQDIADFFEALAEMPGESQRAQFEALLLARREKTTQSSMGAVVP